MVDVVLNVLLSAVILASEFTEASDVGAAGALAVAQKDERACREVFQMALKRFPDSAGWLNYEFGNARQRFDAYGDEFACFRAAYENPSGIDAGTAAHGLAKSLDGLAQKVGAWAIYQEILADKAAKSSHLADAGFFGASERDPEPMAISDRAIAAAKTEKDKAYALRMKGGEFLKTLQYEEAIEVFQTSRVMADKDPKDDVEVTPWLRGLAIASYHAGRSDQAEAYYRELIAKDKAWADPETVQKANEPDVDLTIAVEWIVQRLATKEAAQPALKP